MSEALKQMVFEALEIEMLYQPEPPYEARSVEDVVADLIKVLPDGIDTDVITEVATEFLEDYTEGRI